MRHCGLSRKFPNLYHGDQQFAVSDGRPKAGGPYMKKLLQWSSFLLLILTTLGVGAVAQAADFRGDEENPNITGTIDDDVYVAGSKVVISGNVSGEVLAAGQDVTLSGSTVGSFMAAAEEIVLSGKVGGTARMIGRTITVEGEVDGDVMGAGQTVEITSEGSVDRDLLVGAQKLNMAGNVGGDIRAGVSTMTIAGTVNGDVEADVDDLSLEAGAKINGDLIYTSANRADIDPAASVTGRIVRKVPADSSNLGDAEKLVLGLLRSIAGALILGLVAMWLLPGLLPSTSTALRSSPLASFLLGIAALVVIPIVAIFLLVVTAFIGAGVSVPLLIMVVYAFLLLAGKVIVAFTLGALVLRVRRGDRRVGKARMFFSLFIGVVILAAVSLIPYLGGFIDLVVILFAMGAALLAFFHWRRGAEGEIDPAGRPAAPEPAPTPARVSATAD
jgi:cytoskeletal protein CcmA (bactofilin family)